MCVQVLISSYEDTSHVGLGPTLMTSVYLNYPFMGPVGKYTRTLRCRGLGLQLRNLGGTIWPVMLPVVSLVELGWFWDIHCFCFRELVASLPEKGEDLEM